MKPHIRWMIRRDFPQVLNIENQCFEYVWLEEDFINCIRERNTIGMVAEYDDNIVGFMVYKLCKRHINIINFAVYPELHRNGIGTTMVNKLIDKLSSERRTFITLGVRETNLSAQLFFKSLEFRATKVLRGFYEDITEDAYLMEYDYKIPMKIVNNRLYEKIYSY